MAHLLGLGVFGTFGQPYGFQQAFNQDVRFSHSLDLDNTDLELYPNTELFAVKREFVGGVYSICFCMYSYAREMNANRTTTFLGSCIVLQQVYIDAEKIYKLLRELHEDLVNNPQNVNNNTIQVRQAVNLVVREPFNFQTAKLGLKSIDETPFYSTNVDAAKRSFVRTSHIESSSQVISFFDEALKNYSDTEVLYFSFSEKVIDSVFKKGSLKIVNWDEFIEHKTQVQQQGVVTSKKGVKPVPAEAKTAAPAPTPQVIPKREAPMQAAPEPEPQIPEPTPPAPPIPAPSVSAPVEVAPEPPPAQATSEPKQTPPVVHDPDFPFDSWSEPGEPWSLDDVSIRVHEYNRLLDYAHHLQAHNEDLQDQWLKLKESTLEPPKIAEVKSDETRSFREEIRDADVGKDDGEIENEKVPLYQRRFFPYVSFVVMILVMGVIYLVANRRLFRKPLPDTTYDTTSVASGPIDTTHPPSHPPVKDTTPQSTKDTAAAVAQPAAATPKEAAKETPKEAPKAIPKETPKVVEKTVEKPAVSAPIGRVLNPQANMELAKSEVASLLRAGIKGRSLSDIVNMIFQKFPVNVGDIYKHQPDDYALNLLMANKTCFQRRGNEYVCVDDNITHIPAYKSPSAKVVFPK